jgi:DNA ligase-1
MSKTCMLAKSYDPAKDNIDGWFCSQKFDGSRGLWSAKDGKMYTKNGNEVFIPAEYTADFPKVDLDGELVGPNGSFEVVTGILRRKTPDYVLWKNAGIKYVVFEEPSSKKTYKENIDNLRNLLKDCKYAQLIDTWPCNNKDDLARYLKEYENAGAEGLMLRDPNSVYEKKRSKYLLKVKSHDDKEATVTGYKPGTGKYTDMCGALTVESVINNKKVVFDIGSGLTADDRENPPKIGSVITFRYNGLSSNGIPKFGRYICVRDYE